MYQQMITRLLNELQHRRAFRAVATYAVVAWIGVVVGTPAPEPTIGLSRVSQLSSWFLVLVLGVAEEILSGRSGAGGPATPARCGWQGLA